VRVEAGSLGVVAQEPLAELVPAADPELLVRPRDQRLAAFAEAAGAGAGAGEDEDPARIGALGGEVGKPPREQLALAGAGGAEPRRGPAAVADRALALGGVAGEGLLLRWHRT